MTSRHPAEELLPIATAQRREVWRGLFSECSTVEYGGRFQATDAVTPLPAFPNQTSGEERRRLPAPLVSARRADRAGMRECVHGRHLSLPESLLFRCLFRRWSCGHDDSGDCFGGTRSCSLLKMGCGDSLDAHLCTKTEGPVRRSQVSPSAAKKQ